MKNDSAFNRHCTHNTQSHSFSNHHIKPQLNKIFSVFAPAGFFVAFDSGFFVAFDSGFFVAFACTGFFVDVDAMGFFVGALVGVAVGASVAIDDRSKPNSTGEWSEQRAGDCPSK